MTRQPWPDAAAGADARTVRNDGLRRSVQDANNHRIKRLAGRCPQCLKSCNGGDLQSHRLTWCAFPSGSWALPAPRCFFAHVVSLAHILPRMG